MIWRSKLEVNGSKELSLDLGLDKGWFGIKVGVYD